MTIKFLTLFPEMFDALSKSIIGRAVSSDAVKIETHNIRDYSKDKHKRCDDIPFGGGAGMVMTPQPIADAIESIDPAHTARRIYMSPKGRVLSDRLARETANNYSELLILCGHYEGIDQRVIDKYIDDEISIGDYVLTGGELAAMVFADAVLRFVSGVLGNSESADSDSFSSGLLEYPQYTRPFEWNGEKVPEVLISGHHANIEKWRRDMSADITKKNRPDLYKAHIKKNPSDK